MWLPILGEDEAPEQPHFTAAPGPRNAPPADAPPIAYAELFFTEQFVQHLVEQTNLYAQQYIQTHHAYLRRKPRSRVHRWIREGETNPVEMRAFLGIILNMGLIRKPSLQGYWDTAHPSQATPWFNQHFSRDRFVLMLKFLHFNNNNHLPDQADPEYRVYKVRPLITHFNSKFREHYTPQRDISIDESMVGFRGKTPSLRQYLPNKRHSRFGVKLWCLADSTNGYLHGFEVYRGAGIPEEPREHIKGPTHALVLRLMRASGLLGLGYHLTMDNYFTSPSLLLELHHNRTVATGTVRSNRRGLPRQAIQQRMRNQEVVERRRGPVLCVAYQDGRRKPVLLSTCASAGTEQVKL